MNDNNAGTTICKTPNPSADDNGVIHAEVNPSKKTDGIRISPLDEITEVLDGYNHYESGGARTSYLGWHNHRRRG